MRFRAQGVGIRVYGAWFDEAGHGALLPLDQLCTTGGSQRLFRTIQLQKPIRLHPRALSRPVSPSQSHSPLSPTVHGREESASVSSGLDHALFLTRPTKVDVRLHGKGNSNCHGARPVHTIISMLQWIQTSRLSRKNSISFSRPSLASCGGGGETCILLPNNQRQHRTSHVLKDVLPLRIRANFCGGPGIRAGGERGWSRQCWCRSA